MTAPTVTASAAGTWRLGDLTVNRLGYGAMRVTGSAAFEHGAPSDRDTAVRVLRRAVELGVNHLDTAAFYFSSLRSANELINTALAPYPEDLVIVTKVGPGRDPWGHWYSASPEQLRGQVEENLRQLGRDQLDVVNYRVGHGSVDTPVADHVAALARLRDAGLVRHIGVSNVTVAQLEEALTVTPVVCVQNQFGLHDQTHGEVLRRCGELGIAFTPFFAIAGAGAARGAVARAGDSDGVLTVARRHGASVAQVRLAWTLAHGPQVLAIPGTGNPKHLEENIAAGALRLTADDLAVIGASTR
jgi:aryl-alcohol dehydrogenase-like predicted oxidoreductase